MTARWLSAWLLCSLLAAQTENPDGRKSAADFPVHGSAQGVEIGAEYLVHSIPSRVGSFFAECCLVVEVALYPSKDVTPTPSHFTLRINGGKFVVAPDTPGMVASSMRYGVTGFGNMQGLADQNAGNQNDNSAIPARLSVDQAVRQAALPEAKTDKPVRGCLYFPFDRKLKSIKSMDLVYDDCAGGTATLHLI